MLLTEGIVVEKITLTEQQYILKILCPSIAQKAQPGQFVTLKVDVNKHDPLLRRPFSIHGVDQEQGIIEIYFQVLGKGTRELKDLQVEEKISILGPLGQGFKVVKDAQALLIGGGLGQAPLKFLTQELVNKNTKVKVLIGARSKNDLKNISYFTDLGGAIQVYTEDGSLGEKGRVMDNLTEIIEEFTPDIIYACGPLPMLISLKKEIKNNPIPCQISLEQKMACGIGVCLGCTCGKNGDKYPKVCVDGPVFWLSEVNMDE